LSDKIDFKVIPPAALENIRNGAKKPIANMTIDEIPPVAISWGRTNVFPTGSWRNITPQYSRQLPPCRSGCPVGNDIEGWLLATRQERWDDAVRLLLSEQPLPSVCGRVCYHPCETACNRGAYDASVSIGAIERNLGDRAARDDSFINEMLTGEKHDARVRIIGSGPAGLAAAWLLVRLGFKVEVVERTPEPGGLLRFGIPAYRLPRDILRQEIRRLEILGVVFKCNTNLDPTLGIKGIQEDFDAVFLAPGAAGHRKSGVFSDNKWIVQDAISLLTRVASDKPHHLGKRVVVIGGGNSALDAARVAVRCGSEVNIIYRRTRQEMPAYYEEIEAAIEEGIRITYLVSPDMIRRNPNGPGRMLRCVRNVLGKPDDSGRRRPEPVPGSEFDIPIDNVIEAVGEYADSSQLTRDEDEVSMLKPLDKWGRTSINGVWVGGDYTSWDRTVAHAIGAGKRAAMSIVNSLEGRETDLDSHVLSKGNSVMVSRFVNKENSTGYDRISPVRFENLNTAYFTQIARNFRKELDPESRGVGFTEVTPDLGAKTVNDEAKRCFHCGACDSCGNCHIFCPDGAVLRDRKTLDLSFDIDHCKGCGVCAAECPRSAIEMV